MSDTANPELIRAYRLIEEENLEEARTLLDSYLERNQNNPDAWWLYAHAVAEPADAQNALRNVLRLNPDYPSAKALLAESEAALAPRTNVVVPKISPQPSTQERVPDFLDQIDVDDEDDFDTFDEDEDAAVAAPSARTSAVGTSNRNRRLLFILVPILIAVIALGVIVALINNLQNRPDTTSTPVAVVSTDIPDDGNIVQQTEESSLITAETTDDVTADASTGDFSGVESFLSEFNVQSIGEEETSLGGTLVVTICNDPSRGLPNTTLNAVDVLARQSETLSFEYLGVRVVDCETGNTPLRTVGFSLADAQALASGSIESGEFRTRLQPIRE
jgi:hypothetical protein